MRFISPHSKIFVIVCAHHLCHSFVARKIVRVFVRAGPGVRAGCRDVRGACLCFIFGPGKYLAYYSFEVTPRHFGRNCSLSATRCLFSTDWKCQEHAYSRPRKMTQRKKNGSEARNGRKEKKSAANLAASTDTTTMNEYANIYREYLRRCTHLVYLHFRFRTYTLSLSRAAGSRSSYFCRSRWRRFSPSQFECC